MLTNFLFFLVMMSPMWGMFLIINIVHKLGEGRMMRPVFNLLCSWWWPHRPEADAGSLIYEAFKITPEKFSSGYDKLRVSMDGKRIEVNFSPSGRAKVTIGDGPAIPLSAWGDNRLYKLYKKVRKREARQVSNVRNRDNQDRFVDGTKELAGLLASAIRKEAPQLTDERVAAFDAEAKYLAAKKVESTFSNWIK